MSLSTEERARFKRDGYLVVRGAIPEDAVRAWIDVLGPLKASLARGLLGSPQIAALAGQPGLGALAAHVLGSGTEAVRGLLFDKTPRRNWAVTWHQDTVIAVDQQPEHEPVGFSAWSTKAGVTHVRPPRSILEAMLTVRLGLDDVQHEDGALHVIPGSHLGGVLNPEEIERARRTTPSMSCAPMRAGDALLMRPLLLHSSPRSSEPSHRRVVHIEYAAAPLPGPLRWARW